MAVTFKLQFFLAILQSQWPNNTKITKTNSKLNIKKELSVYTVCMYLPFFKKIFIGRTHYWNVIEKGFYSL